MSSCRPRQVGWQIVAVNGVSVTNDATFVAATAPFKENKSAADITFRIAQDWSAPNVIPIATPLPATTVTVETRREYAHDNRALAETEGVVDVGSTPNQPSEHGVSSLADPSGHQRGSMSYIWLEGTTGGERLAVES